MTEEEIKEQIAFHAQQLSKYLDDLENCTGKRFAIVLDDGETYSGFSGCTIDEILDHDPRTGDEGLNNNVLSIASF
jgi:hypothetical protein